MVAADGTTSGRGQPAAGTDAAEAAGFDELYRSEWSALVGLGWSLTGSWSTAEELAQDAFADAYRRWPEVGRLDRPGAWVELLRVSGYGVSVADLRSMAEGLRPVSDGDWRSLT